MIYTARAAMWAEVGTLRAMFDDVPMGPDCGSLLGHSLCIHKRLNDQLEEVCNGIYATVVEAEDNVTEAQGRDSQD